MKARENAVLELKNLLQNSPKILRDNLNTILQRMLSLMMDPEGSVRKLFLGLMSLIFNSLSENEISPFFSNILAHLCSAMSHLNENVRLDSFKFLDLCLTRYPQLIKGNPQNIITNFINLISVGKSSDKKGGSISMDRKVRAEILTQKRQLEILRRLNHLLCVVFDNGSSNPKDSSCAALTSNNNSKVPVNGNNSTTLSVNPILISNFTLATAPAEFQALSGNGKWLIEIISSLAPVLYEYWVESCADKSWKRGSISLQVMKEILEILLTIYKNLQKSISNLNSLKDVFNCKALCQFYSYFNEHFPLNFSSLQSGRESKESITSIQLNILIAQVMSYYIHYNESASLEQSTSKIIIYLKNVLTGKVSKRQQAEFDESQIKALVELVKMFLFNLSEKFENNKVQLLQSMCNLFENSSVTLHTKSVLVDLLAEMLDFTRSHGESVITILDRWLCSLLNYIDKNINNDLKYKIFLVCKLGIIRRFPILHNAVIEKLPWVFAVENFSKMNEKVQQIVIEILYYTKQVPSRKLYEILAKLCNCGCLSLQVLEYLLFVVHQLVHGWQESSFVKDLTNYLSFILSIVIGHTQDKLEEIQVNGKEHHSYYTFKEISELYTIIAEFECSEGTTQITEESWIHTNCTIEIICQHLAQSDHCGKFYEMFEASLWKFFNKFPVLPVEVLYRLLYLLQKLVQLAKKTDTGCNSSEQSKTLSPWFLVIWHFLTKIRTEFGNVSLILLLTRDLIKCISKLCQSEGTLKDMLDLFSPCILSVVPGNNLQLTCCVLTEMLKELQDALTLIHLPVLDDIYKNLDSAAGEWKLSGQVFSDFKYQYQISTRRFLT